MSQTIKQQHDYSVAMDQLLPYFLNPMMVEKKHAAMGGRQITIERREIDELCTKIKIKKEVEVDPAIPSTLKKFVGEWSYIEQKERWFQYDSYWECKIDIDIKGVPAKVTGNMKLENNEQGCCNNFVITVSSSVPFIGGVICEFVGKSIQRAAQLEYNTICDLLNQ